MSPNSLLDILFSICDQMYFSLEVAHRLKEASANTQKGYQIPKSFLSNLQSSKTFERRGKAKIITPPRTLISQISP